MNEEALTIVDAALAEFSSRGTVPAKTIIDPISQVDPACAERLRALTSQIHDDPGVLHQRDALDVLLDLRSALRNAVLEPDPQEALIP